MSSLATPPSAASSAVSTPLAIERLTVCDDRVVAQVVLAPDAPRFTTPRLMEQVLASYPTLAHHACVNTCGNTFAAVMNHTSLPHVLEHVVVDLQTRAATDDPKSAVAFVGTTRWTDESEGRAQVSVSFTDDLVALRAFRDAVDFLNRAVVTCSA